MLVLWGARAVDVQVGSREDDRAMAAERRARAMRSLARAAAQIGRAYSQQLAAVGHAVGRLGEAYGAWARQVQRDLAEVRVGER